MLRSGRKLTAAQIADTLEISVRTVYRYIDALCASGVPIVADSGHDGGFRIMTSFKETPLFFNTVELKAIVDASKFAKGAGYPYTNELAEALEKIEHGLNEEQALDLHRHTSGLDVIFPALRPGIVPLLRQLEQSIVDGQTLRIEYRKETADEASGRDIDPYGLAYRRNEWYVVAYCHRSADIRTFRVDRIAQADRAGTSFVKPDHFSAEHYFREQSERGREAEGPMALLRIRGDTKSLNALCAHWHLHHYVKKRTETEAHFLIDAPTVDKYLPVYLLTFGTAIEVMEPVALREQVKERALQIARHYGERNI